MEAAAVLTFLKASLSSPCTSRTWVGVPPRASSKCWDNMALAAVSSCRSQDLCSEGLQLHMLGLAL